MVRLGETWEGRERRGEDGEDVGRPGETWGGWDRRGEAGRDDGRVCTSRRWCVEGLALMADPQIDALYDSFRSF